MKLLSRLLQSNQINVAIDKFVFYKIFLLLVLFARTPLILWQVTAYEKLNIQAVSIFQLTVSHEVSIISSIFFALSSLICLALDKTNWMLRVAIFMSYSITHLASASAGLNVALEYSMLVLFIFLTLIPQSEYENKEGTFFNRQIWYATFIILLLYTISGLHKLHNFLPCLFNSDCLTQTGFLDFQVYSGAIKRNYKVLFESSFASLTVLQSNLVYLFVCLLEFVAVFSIFSRKWLKTQLIMLCLFHLLAAIYIRAYFVPMMLMHLFLISFCFKINVKK